MAARVSRNHVLNSPGNAVRDDHRGVGPALRGGGRRDDAGPTRPPDDGHRPAATSSSAIIPQSALRRPMWTVESFNVFDDATVHVELLSAQVTVTVPGEIVVYLRAFDQLAGLAVYGTEARSLISRAISDLS